MQQTAPRLILGIDPGLVKTGWGVVTFWQRVAKYIDCGTIKTSPTADIGCRLFEIYSAIGELFVKHNLTDVAIEKVFVNTNPLSSEKLIMARTAAFLAASAHGFVVAEFGANEIKKSVTGFGHAMKSRVHAMVRSILKIDRDEKISTDAADALAAALCCGMKCTINPM